jgi:glycosyltransferase involved in cell wall biosynthesis
MNTPYFTVFTPTYNRCELLERVFQCLRAQSDLDFEWLIIDDGSTDATSEWVTGLLKAPLPFKIRYHYQKNSGKHGAHNTAISMADGFALVVLDSDDLLVPDALEILRKRWDGLEGKDSYVGVFGLFAYANGEVVGDRFPQDGTVSNAIDLRYNLKVHGDKIGFNRTDVLRDYPFPEGVGSACVSESLIWNRISQKYCSLFINHVIGIKEYLPGGLTDTSALSDYRSPKAGCLHAEELLNGAIKIPFFARVKTSVRLLRCALYARKNPFTHLRWSQRIMMLGLTPLAAAVIARDIVRIIGASHKQVG